MSVTFGFYSSLNGDRKYSTEQISSIFDGIISDGVYSTIGNHLIVRESDAMNVVVGTGRCWFNHTWTLNDLDLPLTIPISEQILDRIDSVVVEVDSSSSGRRNQIRVIKGTPSSFPMPPVLQKQGPVYQYSLADIRVPAKATHIYARNITNNVGTSKCPFVTGVITSVTVDEILKQWEAEWDDVLARRDREWYEWFNRTSIEKDKQLDEYIAKTEATIDSLLGSADQQIAAYIKFIEDQIASGDSTVNEWIATKTVEFDTWFDSIKGQLSGDIATDLTNRMNDVEDYNLWWKYMILTGIMMGPLSDDTDTIIVDDTGNAIVAEWTCSCN